MKTKSQEGIIIILSLVMLFVVSTLIIGFLSYVNKSIKVTDREIVDTKAFYIAEAGLIDILKYLSYPVGARIANNFAGGSYVVRRWGKYNHFESVGFYPNRYTRIDISYSIVDGKLVEIDGFYPRRY